MNQRERRSESNTIMNLEEVDRLFEKQARYEVEMKEQVTKEHEERLKAFWAFRRTQPPQFPNDALAKEKRRAQERRGDAASAKEETQSIQAFFARRSRDEIRGILKKGVLEGVLRIHETDWGFEMDTPRKEVEEYVSQHPKIKSKLPVSDELQKGWFLLGAVADSDEERANLVRNGLVQEFQAESPSDFMLVDLAAANYLRAMYAMRLEMQSIRYADNYRMEMFEIMMEGVQPYIHSCQNQLLRVLRALRARRQVASSSTFTHETYTRTDINLQSWGLPLLRALAEITERKEQDIGIDEIKLAMDRYGKGLDFESIPNSLIGYALGRFGFIEKVHVSDGQRYNIQRKRVLTLLNESLKS